MKSSWQDRVADFWRTADDSNVEETLVAMKALVAELDETDARAAFELASVHDFLGLEQEAIPLYNEALELGLEGIAREKAVIQLASSLRNVDKPLEAIALLQATNFSDEAKGAASVFVALAKFDIGDKAEALTLAREDSYPADGMYARSIKFYLSQLVSAELN
jgi:tetratricopeptide (TPR) repeat protein